MSAWDDGVTWHLEIVTPPDLNADTLTAEFILEQQIRSADPDAETDYIERLRRVSLREAERITRQALLEQTWALVLNRFPSGPIVLPRPPLIAVESITYIDGDGAEQVLGGSPAMFKTVTPSSSGTPAKGYVQPLFGETWPSTRAEPDAVRVVYRCGYANPDLIPDDITQARLIAMTEMYKQRSESVHISQSKAMRVARDLYTANRVWEY